MALHTLSDIFTELGITETTTFATPCCGRIVSIGDPTPRNPSTRLCRNQCCTEVFCLCGALDFSYGPAGCRCGAGGPNPGTAWRTRRLTGGRR